MLLRQQENCAIHHEEKLGMKSLYSLAHGDVIIYIGDSEPVI